jgi:Zn-dependent protease with chaperone function
LTEAVAQKVGTRPIDGIFLTPGTEIAVFERGSTWTKFFGRGKRYLVIGLGVMRDMTQGQLQAILAHEYGHFNNRDTAGGNIALQIQVQIQQMAIALMMGQQNQWYNPAWHFIRAYQHLFLRVTRGASRLQEILADRYAALAYGAQDFSEGLMHVVRQSIAFDYTTKTEINLALQEKRSMQNLYTVPEPDMLIKKQHIEPKFKELWQRGTSEYDSHPAPHERIRLVQQLAALPTTSNTAPVWDLLPNPSVLQDRMTRQIQNNVTQALRQRGVYKAFK